MFFKKYQIFLRVLKIKVKADFFSFDLEIFRSNPLKILSVAKNSRLKVESKSHQGHKN
jgi:hypothetical protein